MDHEEGRRFVDALLDTEPNHLDAGFRDALYLHTAGHPLFTIELLRAMQERGDLVRRSGGDRAWVETPGLDWDRLPARVEAVIEERIVRLEPLLLDILSVASIVGDSFDAQLVAAAMPMPERSCLRALGRLERLYHLVRLQSEGQTGSGWAVHYQFSHILVQNHLYRRLGSGERRLLHRQVAEALLVLHSEDPDQVAVQLARHFLGAADDQRAFRYSIVAAANAGRAHAHQAAIALYTQAIELADRVGSDTVRHAELLRGRGLGSATLGEFERARGDFETCLAIGRAAGNQRIAWRALLDLVGLWALRDYGRSRELIDQALELAQQIGDPAVLATTFNRVGNWWLNQEHLPEAIDYHRQALAILEQLGNREAAAHTLDDLGLATQIHGDLYASIAYYDRAIAAFRELGDLPGLCSSLIGRALAATAQTFTTTLIPPRGAVVSRGDLEEALQIAQETNAPDAEGWALWSLSIHDLAQGQFGLALDHIERARIVATSIGHLEWIAGAHAILGGIYTELLAPELARPELEEALALAEELQSRHWFHYATGTLAATCCSCSDVGSARSCLDCVLAPPAPMDTIHRRTCWARRAEVALLEGDPATALDIVDRLIDSAPHTAPSPEPRPVIPFLWQLRAEILAAMGRTTEALLLLETALAHAQDYPARLPLWRLHASLARVYRALDQQSESEKELAQARACILELAETVPVEGLREQFVARANALLT